MPDSKDLAHYIDHTLLRPDAAESEIAKLCEEAREFSFRTVCIEAKWLPLAAKKLKGSSVWPITVVSFPHGTDASAKKAADAAAAVQAGAREVDMVLNRALVQGRRFQECLADIRAVVEASGSVPVKVILETSELTREEKIMACVLSKLAGAKFVKTSTGFSKGGATAEDVRLMRDTVGKEMGVKASGGIRTTDDARAMVAAGADRLGCSASIAIVGGKPNASGGGY